MLFIFGRSASGKTEIVKKLISIYKMNKLVTYTTRNIRVGERDKIDYNFITIEDFKNKITNNFFFEYVEYNGNYYGTAIEDISDNKVVILEPNGVKLYKERLNPNQVFIVYLKCDDKTSKERMMNRKDNEFDIELRIKNDGSIFTNEYDQYSNLIIDTSNDTIDSITNKIFNAYKQYGK